MKLLTTQEAADFLGIHRDTLSRYVREGRVNAKESVKGYFFTKEALKLFKRREKPRRGNPLGWKQFNDRRKKKKKKA